MKLERKLLKFLKEEDAQGAIEYILIAGGVVVVAIAVYFIYSRMTKSSAEVIGNATEEVGQKWGEVISNTSQNWT